MGSFFDVDIFELDEFISKLNKSEAALESALKALSSVDGSAIGTVDLDEAANDFHGKWKYGAEQLKEQVADLTKGVKASRDAYRQVDEGIAQYLSRHDDVSKPGAAEGKERRK